MRTLRLVMLMGMMASCSGEPDAPNADTDTRAALVNAPSRFTVFESDQVRPLALSPDGKRLFATNTPDGRLEIFDVKTSGLSLRSSVPVGMEPVAVAVRSDDEVWVVNHLSDSVSIVSIDGSGRGQVTRTLLVGDEPRDIVFGGPQHDRAFITTAHRGQNSPVDPASNTPGVGRADVWVFNANNLGASLGGTPLTILSLFTDTPRALAVSNDGRRVYAAGFHTGNQTTAVVFTEVLFKGGPPPPNANAAGVPEPIHSLIVHWNGSHWVDEIGRNFDSSVRFSLPDKDVFVIDATANPPAQLAGAAGSYAGVGTTLFNMVTNPVNGKVYVSNTDAQNMNRFEGAGTLAGHSVRGHLAESRITVLGAGSVTPRHLNKHINYAVCCAPIPNAENAKSLAQPQGMAISSDGNKLYVAAFGSSKIGIYDTASLENDSFVPNTSNQVTVSGGGPTGVVLDESRRRLYVLTRFDNAISVISTNTKSEIGHVPLYNPEPASVITGRRFLYDAALTSSHGDSACASCHISADLDHLAWDLGNPDADVLTNPGSFVTRVTVSPDFHPMKGPMTTQSLRGMANHGPMHWRGDRTGGNDAVSAQPDSGSFDEAAGFKKFNPAFQSLIGRDQPLSSAQMAAFTDFILQVTYPPNPIRALDNSLTAAQEHGRLLTTQVTDLGQPSPEGAPLLCVNCHVLDRQGNAQYGVAAPGFFGSDGRIAQELNFFKVPQLRNLYQKVGMFGIPALPGSALPDPGFQGDQIRGFGYFNDGSVDKISTFMAIGGFNFSTGASGAQDRLDVQDYILAYDSNLAPIVGQQITLTATNGLVVGARIDLLRQRAELSECDLIAKSRLGDNELGYLYVGGGRFRPDRTSAPQISDFALRALVTITRVPLTYTCVPPGSGVRMGIDADSDGYFDGDERQEGTDPRNPSSHPHH